MDAVNKIVIDVSDPLNIPVVKSVQEDVRSRFIEISLVTNGQPLDIPSDAHGMIGIRRPNGTYVLYDEDEDGDPAVTFDGNVATAYLSQEALAFAGDMYTSVSVYTSNQRLTAFHFIVSVEQTAVPSDVVVESDYFNILEGVVEDALDAAERAEEAVASLTHASTTQAGIVQLVDGITSTSVTMAPTANAMRMVEPKKKVFSNVSAVFSADATYTAYPYRASIALTGVTASMIPEVVFDVEDATSGAYAPVAAAYDGGVYVYSSNGSSVTIPTVIVWGGV